MTLGVSGNRPIGRPGRLARAILFGAALCASAGVVVSCRGSGGQADEGEKAKVVPVTAALAERRAVPFQISTFGTAEAYRTVSVRAQVAGELVKVFVKDGQSVSANDPLFNIDPQIPRANLDAAQARLEAAQARLEAAKARTSMAEANLARDLAQLRNAQGDYDRAEDLRRRGVATPREYDQAKNALDGLRAATQAEHASIRAEQASIRVEQASTQAEAVGIRMANIQLGFTEVSAPLSGVIGEVLIQKGNLVKVNDLPIMVINQVDPIYVQFAIPQQERETLRHALGAGPVYVRASVTPSMVVRSPGGSSHKAEVPASGPASAPARATTMPTSAPAATTGPDGQWIVGRVVSFDNQVDPSTGMIAVKAEVANGDRRLWPGQFVNVVLQLAEAEAVVVPNEAVSPGQQGPQVFVVRAGAASGGEKTGVVQLRQVSTGRSVEGWTVIESGVSAGERVVVDGQLNLTDGARIVEKPAVNRAGGAE